MATAKGQDRAAREALALELAQARHLDGTARLVHDGDLARHYIVLSADRTGDHKVTIGQGVTVCDCVANAYGKPCSHVGACLHAERQRASSGEGDTALRWFAHGEEW